MTRWKKLGKSTLPIAEQFLHEQEELCVNAISRFSAGTANNVWAVFLPGTALRERKISALLLYGKQFLFPAFCFSREQTAEYRSNGLPLPCFFPLILKSNSLHAAQGLAGDMDLLESALGKKGFFSVSKYDYELRSFVFTGQDFKLQFPQGLVIRKAKMADANALFPLQAAYEKEEVLPEGAVFNPALCRKALESLIVDGMILMAELEGKPVGKININARSYTCFQIGGVFVIPEYRCRNIARAMTAALIREFEPEKKHFTLFVKKTNIPALRAYDSLGFVKTGNYRITYYE